jgi:hypothetical protein
MNCDGDEQSRRKEAISGLSDMAKIAQNQAFLSNNQTDFYSSMRKYALSIIIQIPLNL